MEDLFCCVVVRYLRDRRSITIVSKKFTFWFGIPKFDVFDCLMVHARLRLPVARGKPEEMFCLIVL